MFKVDGSTGYLYCSSNTLTMMLNILYHEYEEDVEQIPWDYIAILLEDLDDYPEA